MKDGRDFYTGRHFVTSRDLVRAQLPNYRHGWNIAAALARVWAFLLGLRP